MKKITSLLLLIFVASVSLTSCHKNKPAQPKNEKWLFEKFITEHYDTSDNLTDTDPPQEKFTVNDYLLLQPDEKFELSIKIEGKDTGTYKLGTTTLTLTYTAGKVESYKVVEKTATKFVIYQEKPELTGKSRLIYYLKK